jgi:hypothetical protein
LVVAVELGEEDAEEGVVDGAARAVTVLWDFGLFIIGVI